MAEDCADSGADLVEFCAGVNCTLVDIEGLWNAPFVQGASRRDDQVVGVLREEEPAVRDDAGRVVNESDEFSVSRSSRWLCRAEHGVELPHFVGELFRKGKTPFGVCLRRRGEKVVCPDKPEEAGLRTV